jgi:hypothetical protein
MLNYLFNYRMYNSFEFAKGWRSYFITAAVAWLIIALKSDYFTRKNSVQKVRPQQVLKAVEADVLREAHISILVWYLLKLALL